MSYQDFPPPLSCSPPPLDSIPAVEDDPDPYELSSSPTFDITGNKFCF